VIYLSMFVRTEQLLQRRGAADARSLKEATRTKHTAVLKDKPVDLSGSLRHAVPAANRSITQFAVPHPLRELSNSTCQT
jgi:hypothetical protein